MSKDMDSDFNLRAQKQKYLKEEILEDDNYDAEEFIEYMQECKPNVEAGDIDNWDFEELVEKVREFKENKRRIESNKNNKKEIKEMKFMNQMQEKFLKILKKLKTVLIMKLQNMKTILKVI